MACFVILAFRHCGRSCQTLGSTNAFEHHTRLGTLRAYIVALVACDVGALGVYQFTGRFNALHVGATMNFVCVIVGIAPFYMSPRPNRWRIHHAMWVCWSYIGLWAAGLTELVVRMCIGHLADKSSEPQSPPRPSLLASASFSCSAFAQLVASEPGGAFQRASPASSASYVKR